MTRSSRPSVREEIAEIKALLLSLTKTVEEEIKDRRQTCLMHTESARITDATNNKRLASLEHTRSRLVGAMKILGYSTAAIGAALSSPVVQRAVKKMSSVLGMVAL